MFSGLVKGVTEVISCEPKDGLVVLTIAKLPHCIVKLGESVAVNGVCLTVTKTTDESCTFELMPETLQKTTFGVSAPKRVNVEQSLRLGDPLDGHVVTGHVDTKGTITDIKEEGETKRLEIEFPPEFARLIADKGSMAVDGVSLTVAGIKGNRFTVGAIPYTLTHTTLGERVVGDLVNLEFDIIAKHLARMTEKL